jgi:hypothetical protein
MKLFTRWMVAVALSLVTASIVLADGRESFPGVRNLPSELSIGLPQRTVLYKNIVHYRWTVRIGRGEHDVIGLHRIVKERRAHHPADPEQAVMLFPGLPTYFTGLYVPPLISDVPARDDAIAIYLAANDIDVWGMDYRWALIPESTSEFGFMRDWGILRDVEDAQIALTIARQLRGRPSEQAGPLFVSGLSYGAMISYAVAANDTQRPRRLRNVRGLIPLDDGVAFDGADYKAESCAYLEQGRQMMDGGTYNWDNRSMWAMGQLAIDDPEGPSPFADGLDNYHFALGVGGWPQGVAIPWHFAGSWLDANGNPVDLRFTTPRLFFDLLARNEPPYSPIRIDVESATVGCGIDHPGATYADHVGDITVPLFYVGAAGGVGHFGDYSTTLVASHDVSILIVQLLPDDQRAEDFGHVDLLTASDAETLVWRPIRDWIKAHR